MSGYIQVQDTAGTGVLGIQKVQGIMEIQWIKEVQGIQEIQWIKKVMGIQEIYKLQEIQEAVGDTENTGNTGDTVYTR